MLKNKEHYYYIDKNNKEWCFKEINGGKNFSILNVQHINVMDSVRY